jgi:hypothetical protein
MPRPLPFDVAPTQAHHEIGTAETGILRFRVRRGISVAERLAIREVDESDAIFQSVAELCLRIHSESSGPDAPTGALQGLQLHEVYLAVNGALNLLAQSTEPPLGPAEAAVALGYREDMQQLKAAREENSERIIIRKATTMIQNRLQGCADWTDEDTAAIDNEGMIIDIAMLYGREAAGNSGEEAASIMRQMQEIQDALGKLQPEPGSPPPNPTGQTSTGDAVLPTPAIPTSAPSASGSSPSATSSRRSKPPAATNASGSPTRNSR